MKPANPHRATPTAAAITGLLLALSAGAALADNLNPAVFHERAPVIRSIPVYASVAHPVRECTQEYERQADPAPSSGAGVDEHRPGRTILGAVIGGLAGSTIGKGNGRVAAAAVGAATGAVIGNNWGGGSSAGTDAGAGEPRKVLVERCRTAERWRQEVVGYDVTYRYLGRELTARLDREPGAEVGVRVTVDATE